MKPVVAVIIPYFQREHGILARAIRAVLQQRNVQPQIIVIDDESPVPAEAEVAEFSASGYDITIIRQKNKGPSAARNTGLDAVRADVEWIALLDSDDIWAIDHLSIALSALTQGYDLFFADHQRDGSSESQFEAAGVSDAKGHPIDAKQNVYEFSGDLFSAVLKHSPIGMSTLVMRRSMFGATRFPTDLYLCEDLLYALQLVRTDARVALGHNIHAVYGKGLNISVIDWNSPRAIMRCINFSRFFAEVRQRFPLNHEQRQSIAEKQKRNREEFARTLLSIVRKRQHMDAGAIGRFMLQNPRTFADLMQVIGLELFHRARGRSS